MSELDSGSTSRSPRRSAPVLWLLFWCVALTGALPYLFAREAMNPSLAVTVVVHIVSGVVLLLCLRQFINTWGRRDPDGADGRRFMPLLAAHGPAVLLTLAGITGAVLLAAAAFGQSIGPWRGAYLGHVVSGLLLAAIALVSGGAWVARKIGRRSTSVASPAFTATAALLLSCGALAATHYAAESYFAQLTAATPTQAHNRLFPAGTQISRSSEWGAAQDVASCGARGCHPTVVTTWHDSAHARSTASVGYRNALVAAAARLGTDGTRWCAGCHAPLSLASANPRAVGQGSDSVNCLSCHAMSAVPAPIGNGHAVYSAPPVYPFAHPKSRPERWLHGFLLRVRPAPHRAGFAGPPENRIASAMCAPCHRLSVNAPQNGYKFLPYDDTWEEWQASPYSGESAHVFHAAKKASCADCHLMPTAGKDPAGSIHDHSGRKPAADVTKSDVNHLVDSLRVEIFALRREAGPDQPSQMEAPLARFPVTLAAGESATVDVVVENRGIGHSFTGGLPSTRSAWLEVRASASQRDRDTESPEVGERHGYGLWALNRDGKLAGRDDFYTMVAPILLRAIPAGEADVARFRFKAPQGVGSIRLTARLLYDAGSFARPAPLEKYRLRPSILASDMVGLAVNRTGDPRYSYPPHAAGAADAQRFFAYGVGLLRPNAGPIELAQARAAFREAIRLRPDNADYLTALARAYLADGDLLSARAQLEQALRLDRRSPQARAWLGNTLLRMGQLEAALAILNPLAREYPRDGALWIDIGLCQLKGAQYQTASESFARALEVDPNDSTAHYNLMRCYTAMNRLTDARREEAIFRALQDDEPLTNLVEPFLQAHPGLRRETLGMHVHTLEVSQ